MKHLRFSPLRILFCSAFHPPEPHVADKRNDLRSRNVTLKPSFHISAPIARIHPYRTKQCTGDPGDFMETVEENLATVEATAVITIARKALCSFDTGYTNDGVKIAHEQKLLARIIWKLACEQAFFFNSLERACSQAIWKPFYAIQTTVKIGMYPSLHWFVRRILLDLRLQNGVRQR